MTNAKPIVSHEQIAARAYERFVRRGHQHGRDLDDWFAAEADVRAEAATSRPPAPPTPPSRSTIQHREVHAPKKTRR